MRVFVTGATGGGSSDSLQEVELPISFSALAIERAGAPVSPKKKRIESLNDDEVLKGSRNAVARLVMGRCF
jgi:hypothetical protein